MYSEDEFDSNFIKSGKTYVVIGLAEDWQYPRREKKITITDVIKYYANDARNISSGMRSIAGIYGDWRMIDYIAGDVLAYFKHVNRAGLAKAAKPYGMTLW